MGASKLLVFSIFVPLLFTRVTADPPLVDDAASASAPEAAADLSLRLQLELLQLKVALLESSIDEKNQELREKDESIRQMVNIIQEKSNSIALIQSEIESVQGRESLDVVQLADKSHVQGGGLEKQVKKFREDIIVQNKKKDELDARASIVEQKIWELSLKLENLRKVNDEQKIGICKTEHKLQVAEASGGWLPHTLTVHIGNFQSYIVTYWNKLGRPALEGIEKVCLWFSTNFICYWNELGRPALDVGIEKALEMKDQVMVWAKLNIERIRTKWIPSLKKQSLEFIAYLEPNIQLVTTKTVDVYHSSKGSIAPLVFKAQEMADPYIQEVKKFTEPYIDQVAMVTIPHLDKVHVVLKLCANKVLHAYRKFITTTTVYHHEVEEKLKKNQLTQPLASMELAWFAATALLTLPAVFLFKLYSAVFRKKTKKRSHSSHANHRHRRL